MKKILVIGCDGMAGHIVKKYLEELGNYDVYGISRKQEKIGRIFKLDVFETEKLNLIFKENTFDVVINCIGLLNQIAENNPDLAIWVNSYFPHFLQRLSLLYNYKLIHISTDCVFSGKEGGYTEKSFKNGIGFYAQTKALGEIINKKDLTFRTSIIGPELKKEGIGLFHWFMNQSDNVFGYNESFWTGVTTLELAKGIDEAIKQNLKGLYHFVNNQKISKYELLNIFNKIFKNNSIKILKNSDYKVDKSLINTRVDFDFEVSSYVNMLKDMKNWIVINKSLYKFYESDL